MKSIFAVAQEETIQANILGMPCKWCTPHVSWIHVFACINGPICEYPTAEIKPAMHPINNPCAGYVITSADVPIAYNQIKIPLLQPK